MTEVMIVLPVVATAAMLILQYQITASAAVIIYTKVESKCDCYSF